jgi:hypothetical protein
VFRAIETEGRRPDFHLEIVARAKEKISSASIRSIQAAKPGFWNSLRFRVSFDIPISVFDFPAEISFLNFAL